MSSSSGYHPSDLVQAVAQIRKLPSFGYRHLLSYVSALKLTVIDAKDLCDATFEASGSYSTVFKCRYNRTDQVAALKEPRYSLSRDESRLEDEVHRNAVANVIQEIRILAQSQLSAHPNLPKLLGVCFRDEAHGFRPCIVQEYASSTLLRYLELHQSVCVEEKLRLCLDVARGLCALHSYGLVHGDIHPKNILLFHENGTLIAKVADLGTCGIESSKEGLIPGTRSFWAPECHPQSHYHLEHSNSSSRDVYTFGLLMWSVFKDCTKNPFPDEEQFTIQHDQIRTFKHLALSQEDCKDTENSSNAMNSFSKLVNLLKSCTVVHPNDRFGILQVCRDVEAIFGDDRYSKDIELIEDLAEKMLLSDPPAPRVREIGRMPLSESVVQRLHSEYRLESRQSSDPRVLLTVAAFYCGAIYVGANRLHQPWATVAKIQWLLKAAEQGYFPTVPALTDDRKALQVLEDFGEVSLRIKHPAFESPEIDISKLLLQLEKFAQMSSIDALNILVFLGGSIPEDLPPDMFPDASKLATYDKPNPDNFAELFAFDAILKWKSIEVGPVDSDATDLIFSAATPLERTAYEDLLEQFMSLSSETTWTRRLEARMMRIAVFGGSEKIARHLVLNRGLNPNQMVDNETHLELSVLFGRNSIVKLLLENGGVVRAYQKDGLSALHLASRHDNAELITMLCEAMKSRKSLSRLIDSSSRTGHLAYWTPLWTAAACQCYTNARILLEYNANPDVEVDGQRPVHLAVNPTSPAPPVSFLNNLIAAGADINVSTSDCIAPLYTALGSSNCTAVFQLLLAGAGSTLHPRTGVTAREEAESNATSIEQDGELPVYDEDRELVPGASATYLAATRFMVEMVRLAEAGAKDWPEDLHRMFAEADPGLLNKMWVIDKIPPTKVLQITIPP